jgi:putative phosphoribosyl transferase
MASTGSEIQIRCDSGHDSLILKGIWSVPDRADGVVIFAHGSGSSRLSPRNRFISDALNQAGMATLLADLLTNSEARERSHLFDIRLMTERLLLLTDWVREQPQLHGKKISYFGASTGAAAALAAAAHKSDEIAAVISRGGRPDLTGPALSDVTAATLLIVGGNDPQVMRLNRRAMQEMSCTKRLETIHGATHLFEEPGALEQVASLAVHWLSLYAGLSRPSVPMAKYVDPKRFLF